MKVDRAAFGFRFSEPGGWDRPKHGIKVTAPVLAVFVKQPVFLGQFLSEYRVVFLHQRIEERLPESMSLIEKSAGARNGVSCHNDDGREKSYTIAYTAVDLQIKKP